MHHAAPRFYVTRKNVDDWLQAVPKMDPASPRRDWYVKNWNVREKIIAAKKNGTFKLIIASAPWHEIANRQQRNRST